MTIPKEMLLEYIKAEDFKSTTDIMTAIKDLFAQVLQGIMEAELESTLGYKKQERRTPESPAEGEEAKVRRNYRNGYSGKTIKTELGEVPINVPRDCLGEYKPQIIEPYCWTSRLGKTVRWRKPILSCSWTPFTTRSAKSAPL